MTKQNHNSNSTQIRNLKSLAASIAHETRNPLSAIQGACEIIRRNLDEAIEFLDLIDISSCRGLVISDIILQNIQDGEIDKSKFVKLSMAAVLDEASASYAFEGAKEKDLLNVNFEDDFDFFGDETLMIFVILNLIRNSLYYRARIDIWLDGDRKCLYFKDGGSNRLENSEQLFSGLMRRIHDSSRASPEPEEFQSEKNDEEFINFSLPFCKRVMKAFGGDISVKSVENEGTEFCLRF
jgi:two-component system CAI-1 autoinducer sensor kinase/phosphatase CqsS